MRQALPSTVQTDGPRTAAGLPPHSFRRRQKSADQRHCSRQNAHSPPCPPPTTTRTVNVGSDHARLGVVPRPRRQQHVSRPPALQPSGRAPEPPLVAPAATRPHQPCGETQRQRRKAPLPPCVEAGASTRGAPHPQRCSAMETYPEWEESAHSRPRPLHHPKPHADGNTAHQTAATVAQRTTERPRQLQGRACAPCLLPVRRHHRRHQRQ